MYRYFKPDIVERALVFESYNILLKRIVQYTTVNNYGYKLIEFCKNNEIYIVNSQFGSGENIGGTTCKNSSTVDYVLSTTNVFRILQNFDVIDFCNFYSDVHIHISVFFIL